MAAAKEINVDNKDQEWYENARSKIVMFCYRQIARSLKEFSCAMQNFSEGAELELEMLEETKEELKTLDRTDPEFWRSYWKVKRLQYLHQCAKQALRLRTEEARLDDGATFVAVREAVKTLTEDLRVEADLIYEVAIEKL